MITKLHGESKFPDPMLINVVVRSHQHSVMFQSLLINPGLTTLAGVTHCPPPLLVKSIEAAGPKPVLRWSPGAGASVRVASVVTEDSPPNTALRVGASIRCPDSSEDLEGGILPSKDSVSLAAPTESQSSSFYPGDIG